MKKVHRVLSGVLVLLALAAAAGAQVSSSVLQGVVTDAQGGVLPGVTVVITNVDTGLTREVSSDAAGFFRATARCRPVRIPSRSGWTASRPTRARV